MIGKVETYNRLCCRPAKRTIRVLDVTLNGIDYIVEGCADTLSAVIKRKGLTYAHVIIDRMGAEEVGYCSSLGHAP